MGCCFLFFLFSPEGGTQYVSLSLSVFQNNTLIVSRTSLSVFGDNSELYSTE